MQFQKLALAVVIAASLAGCKSGGGGGSDAPAPVKKPVPKEVGAFYDAPTNGLYYVTYGKDGKETGSGYTSAIEGENGSFRYNDGDSIEFYLGGPGGLLVGRGEARSFIMPQDIASPTVARNAARLLLSVDGDKKNKKVIEISENLKSLDKEKQEKLSSIDLGAFKDATIIKTLGKVGGGFQDAELVSENEVFEHLNNTAKTVSEKREGIAKSRKTTPAKENPVIDGLDLSGKITREDTVLLQAGSERCAMDLTGVIHADKAKEADKIHAQVDKEYKKHFPSMVYKSDHFQDGKYGDLNYKGFGDDIKKNSCELNQDTVLKKNKFEPYVPQEEREEETHTSAEEVSGFSNELNHLDMETDDDGGWKQYSDKTRKVGTKLLKIADGSYSNRRNFYSYAAEAGIRIHTQVRDPMKGDGVVQKDPKGNEFWVSHDTTGSKWLTMYYFVNETEAKNYWPKFIDLSGKWDIQVFFPENKKNNCGAASEAEEQTFGPVSYNDGGYFYERAEKGCGLVKKSGNAVTNYVDEASKDMWFLDYNKRAYKDVPGIQKGAFATLQQLNSRVKWKSKDTKRKEYTEYVRWSYMPAGKNGNKGTLYRYKEEADGTIISTSIYTRAKK